MLGNQTTFEILRDLVPLIEGLEEGEALAVSVSRVVMPHCPSGRLFNWASTKGESYSSSRIAHAMQRAYKLEGKQERTHG